MAERTEVTQPFTSDAPQQAGSRAYVVRVVEGIDAGLSVRVDTELPQRLLVGKGPTADLRLKDPAVSRRHIALDVENGRLRVTDMGSMNGTYLDGHQVVSAYAVVGEQIQIGRTLLRVEPAVEQAPPHMGSACAFGRVLGSSAAMRRLYPLCERLARSDVPVVIEGETGTGKEALAEALHETSARANAPFVVFDCTAVPPNLAEAELFGHEKGAFTGATGTRKGVFELAEGGTLLIDEIGDLDATLQPKLLRAVERSEIRRIGASKPIRCNVRLLAATRRNLEQEVQAGRFRDDLFHRMAVARIELPALRDRREDIPVLAQAFWTQLGGEDKGIPRALMALWIESPWQGNVRELRNAVARRIALGDLDGQQASAAPEQAAGLSLEQEFDTLLAMDLPFTRARRAAIGAFERRYVERVLAQNRGNVGAAAAASGIARRYFQVIRERQRK